MTPLSTPKVELNIWFFQIRPATTGMIRKGVMSSVRAMPRPKNCAVEQDRQQRAEEQRQEHRGDRHHDG